MTGKLSGALKNNRLSLCILVALACLPLFMLINSQKVNAHGCHVTIDNPPPPPFFPAPVEDYLIHACGYSQTPAYAPWLSPADVPYEDEVNVTSSDTSVELEYHLAAIVGWAHSNPLNATARNKNVIVNASSDRGGTFSAGFIGATSMREFDFRPTSNEPGTFRHVGRKFTYSQAGGFTTGIHTIRVTFKSINHFEAGVYHCVGGDEAEVTQAEYDAGNFDKCVEIDAYISINVTNFVGVQGRIYDASTGAVIPNVTADTCNYGSVTSNSNGDLLFTANNTAAYCLRITSVPSGYDISTVKVRPGGGVGYLECAPDEPVTGVTCTRTTYECQSPGSHTTACGGADRSIDYAFDFVISPTATSLDCPPMPDPTVDVTLTDQRTYPASDSSTPSSVSGSSTSGYGSLAPDVYKDVNDTDPYVVNSAQDEWGQEPGMERPIGVRGNNQVEVDYTPFIEDYPYDYHNPTLNYTQYFTRHRYTAYRSEAYSHTHDPAPYCTDYDPTYDEDGNFTGWECVEYYDPPPYTEYHWTDTYTLASSTPQSPSRNMSPPEGGLVTLHKCYDRTYDTTGVSFNNLSITPDRENPNTATLNATINVAFNVVRPDLGLPNMRRASRVTYPHDVNWGILRFGSGTVVDQGAIVNGQNITIVASSTAKQSQGFGATGGSVNISVEQTATDLRVGDMVCWRVRVRNGFERGTIDAYGNTVTRTGEHLSPWECRTPIVNWPYIKVFGNDVVSGGTFTAGCNNAAPIRAFARTGAPRGSSTQYAVFALGTITGFTSAGVRNGAGTPASGPLGLTFANTTGAPFGGGYAANDGLSCMPNYFASRPDTTQATANLATQFNAPNTDPNRVEYYEINGNFTHNAGVQVRNGVRKVFYINGTLNINSDIRYQNDSWNDRNNIPFIVIIARDINIAPGVTRLDGVFVAQSWNGGTGTINTCTTNYAACRNPLVVNGALFANRVNFYRTRGSMRNAVQDEGRLGVTPGVGGNNRCSSPWGTTQVANNAGSLGGNTCAGELISFSPEVYLSLSQILIPEDSFRLDSYVTLPPNL